MEQKPMNYTFYPVDTCEMCGSGPEQHKVLGQRLNQSQGNSPKKKSGIAVSVMKCRNCGLIFSNPMPVPHDIQDHYGVPPENYWTEEYFILDDNYFSDQIDCLEKLMPVKQGMRALDIGAGLGKCMIALGKKGFDAYGFEPSLPFYKKAIEKMGISPEKLRVGMMEEMEYPAEEFDFITFGAVLEHLYHPAQSIAKAMQWLKPGGIIHIEVPSSKHLVSKIFNAYYRFRGTNYVTHISPMHAPFHLYEFDVRSFQRLGEKQNFEIVRTDYFVCEIFFLPSMIKPVLSAYMKWTDTGMQLSIWLKKKG
jgi:2-polyprenyl-3-methyl-5-hydroxy-6-metoxy-1,4-benzoquinol methylase